MQLERKHFLADLNLFRATAEKTNPQAILPLLPLNSASPKGKSPIVWITENVTILYLILLYTIFGFLKQPTHRAYCNWQGSHGTFL